MGGRISHQKKVAAEERELKQVQQKQGIEFPGSDFHASDHKQWMLSSNLSKATLRQIMWPGTHDSATDGMGLPLLIRPLVQCQTCSVYHQLLRGTRVLDIRVDHTMHVCHGIIQGYCLHIVIQQVLKFLSETCMEFIILQIRTEYGHRDPPEIEEWLIQQLGDHLLAPQMSVFGKTLGELMPKRVICVWKPSSSSSPAVSPLWSSGFLRDNWIDTDLPVTKFESNMEYLAAQVPVDSRYYFYRVENTVTPQADSLVVCVKPVTNRIRGYARLFISQAFRRGYGDRLQVFSCDFIDEDFVDACIGVTLSRVEGKDEESDSK
ncbi:uncharacterized protein LOC131075063 [Cryptomeria japonica]|uniref:uncharacterized protein LOC131075063 n=1 Tax=Cryptomeria japonica TaxID=3369 RepID=UPI0027DA58E8|nr:uncharacterized protein LOC131075063 [Cryptomeria japonica]